MTLSNQLQLKKTLLVVTKSVHHPLAQQALRYANGYLNLHSLHKQTDTDKPSLNVFFYADGATFANAITWQSADQPNFRQQWQQLAKTFELDLMVCVSTALARGISDIDNGKRHQLKHHNLAEGFRLVGLSELAMHMADSQVLQF